MHKAIPSSNVTISCITTLNCSHQVKLVLVGDTDTGKTAILQRFAYDIFREPGPFTQGQLYETTKSRLRWQSSCPFMFRS